MPIHLEPRDVSADLENFNSVLIVSCLVCAPMSVAMQQKSPFIEFFKRGLKTKDTPTPVMCIWTDWKKAAITRSISIKD
jgi:hypothetical protein